MDTEQVKLYQKGIWEIVMLQNRRQRDRKEEEMGKRMSENLGKI